MEQGILIFTIYYLTVIYVYVENQYLPIVFYNLHVFNTNRKSFESLHIFSFTRTIYLHVSLKLD